MSRSRMNRRAARRARLLSWIEGLAALGAVVFTVVVGLVGGYVYVQLPKIPDLSPLEDYADASKWSLPTEIFAADGTLVARFQEERRDIIPFDRMPKVMVDAIVAAEDKNFWRAWHWGVDPVGIARAAWTNLRGGRLQGASTITMQLARNLYLTRDRTYVRKTNEAILALQVERRFTKQEILERYLNKVYFGRQAYGVAAAADRYFGIRLAAGDSLPLSAAAFLAGLPQSPSAYGADTEAGIRRARQVLDRMVEDGYASRAEAESAAAEIPSLLTRSTALRQVEYAGGIEGSAPWFAEHVRRQLLLTWEPEAVYRGGLKVHTTLDSAVQAAAQAALETGLARLQREIDGRYPRGRAPAHRIEGAVLALDASTGRILAMVGGSRWSATNQFNRTVQAHRQPGSAFKPFVYAAALLQGMEGEVPVTPATVLFDLPFEMEDGTGETWRPNNYDKDFRGPVTTRAALAKSINIPTIDLVRIVGPEAVAKMAHACGISSPVPPVYSLALGTAEVTMLELTAAYGAFAHRGIWTEPVAITSVANREGFVEREYRGEVREAVDPALAEMMTSMLREVVDHGTAAGAVGGRLGRPAAGKTGTTDEYTDAWFVGWTPEMVVSVWVGYDEGKISMGSGMTGAHGPAVIWADFVKAALAGRPVTPFPAYERLIEVLVDPSTGLRATSSCAGASPEWFLPGRVPPECSPMAEHEMRARFAAAVSADTAAAAIFPDYVGSEVGGPTSYPVPGAAARGEVPPPAVDRLGIR